jgi:hypothetical protein
LRSLTGRRQTAVESASGSVAEVEVVDVVEGDVGQSPGAGSAVLEVDVFEAFGDDLAYLQVAGSGVTGVEEALCVRRGRCTVSRRKRPSSVVPTGAVQPNRALVSTVIPPVAAACPARRCGELPAVSFAQRAYGRRRGEV